MGRPQHGLGEWGSIRCERLARGGYRARAYVRDFDGVRREVERKGKSMDAARRALLAALRERKRGGAGELVTPETRVAELAALWFAEFTAKGKAAGTMTAYRDRLDNQILPALGGLRVRECSVSVVTRFLKAIPSPSVAKMTRAVLSGVLGLAVSHDALERNPVREVAARPMEKKRPARALSIVEVRSLQTWLTYDDKAIARDIPDLVAVMLATGLRIGECAALVWDAVDLDAGTVEVRGTVIRLKGKGLIIQPEPKSESGFRTLLLPAWCLALLRRRRPASWRGTDPVLPAVKGGLRDPSNTADHLRSALDFAGFDWVTSHTFRKTVATVIDDAGLSARTAADQLGHAKVSMTQDVYFGRKIASTSAAPALEALGLSA